MRIPLPQKVKLALKMRLKSLRRYYVHWRYAFDADQLFSFLRELGLQESDVVLVHSSLGAFEGFQGQPIDIISTLQRCVGKNGTILMPTMPFSGTAIDYVKTHRPLNVLRTPSRMGFITELFRRSSGVIRSVHPTHPVAVWGKCSEAIIAGHEKCHTPCGRGSPFGRLLDYNGKILFLGTGIGVLTFLHTVEEIMEKELPLPVFTEEIFHLVTIDANGSEVETNTRLYDPVVSRKRNPFKVIPELKMRGKWSEAHLGMLDAVLINAEDVLGVVRDMAKEGKYCYNGIS
jgi:aminoglycoside N3'-acetyltransferase